MSCRLQTKTIGALLISYSCLSFSAVNINFDTTLTSHSEQSLNFFKAQTASSGDSAKALANLIDRFPQKTSDFLSIALTLYPEEYERLIITSVEINPMFVDEILLVANEHNVASATDIVELVITAEPSYASTATSAACELTPEKFNDIVKTAVNLEPDSADQIAKKLVKRFPTKTMEILTTTLKEVPYVGKYVLDALLTTAEQDKDKSDDMIIYSVEQLAMYPDAMERLIELAKHRNIAPEKIEQSALKGGMTKSMLAKLMSQYE